MAIDDSQLEREVEILRLYCCGVSVTGDMPVDVGTVRFLARFYLDRHKYREDILVEIAGHIHEVLTSETMINVTRLEDRSRVKVRLRLLWKRLKSLWR